MTFVGGESMMREKSDPDRLRGPLRASGCICGKHLFQVANEGTCAWCGHGLARPVVEFAYRRNMEGNVRSAVAPPPLEDRPKSKPLIVAPPRLVPLAAARRWTWDADACASAALAAEARSGRFPSAGDWQQSLRHGEHRPSYGTVVNRFGSWSAFKRYCADIPREAVAA
jgi:ribosomal protein L37E